MVLAPRTVLAHGRYGRVPLRMASYIESHGAGMKSWSSEAITASGRSGERAEQGFQLRCTLPLFVRPARHFPSDRRRQEAQHQHPQDAEQYAPEAQRANQGTAQRSMWDGTWRM
jgi:hypothetical protein